MHNAMAQALINAGIRTNDGHLITNDDKRGRFRAGVSTKLSYRTYQALKAQEILA